MFQADNVCTKLPPNAVAYGGLVFKNANVLKRTVLSSSNPVDIGMDNACTVLKTGITELLKDK